MWTSGKTVSDEAEASSRVWPVQSRRCHVSGRPWTGGGDTMRSRSLGLSTSVVSEEMDGGRVLWWRFDVAAGQEKEVTKEDHVGQGFAMGLERTRTLYLDILAADLQISGLCNGILSFA